MIVASSAPVLPLETTAIQALVVPMNMLIAVVLTTMYYAMARTHKAHPQHAAQCLKLLALGWGLSIPYLFLEFYRTWQSIADPAHGDNSPPMWLAIGFSSVSSAVIFGASVHPLYAPRAVRRAILLGIALTCLIYVWTSIVLSDTTVESMSSPSAIAFIAFSMVATLHQAEALRRILPSSKERRLTWRDNVFIIVPLVLYALLQWLYLPNLVDSNVHLGVWTAKALRAPLNPWGFSLGLVFKTWHLAGLVLAESRRAVLLSRVAGKENEIARTTRLLSKALHELKTAGKELELGVAALEADVLTKQNIRTSSVAAQGSGVRVLAILEGVHQIVSSDRLPNQATLDPWGKARLTTLLEAAALTVKATYPLLHKEKQYDHRVEHECHYSANMDIYCRRFRLTQLFVNLIRNAYDAMYPTGGLLRLTAKWQEKRSPEGTRVALVSLEDEGHGVPRELKDRIFDEGFTTRVPAENRGHGMGIVREVVEEHGGSLLIHSPVRGGRGTMIEVRLRSTPRVGEEA